MTALYAQRRDDILKTAVEQLKSLIKEALNDGVHVRIDCYSRADYGYALGYMKRVHWDAKDELKHVGSVIDNVPPDYLKIDWRHLRLDSKR